jgi:type I restriction enzyme M protein
LAYPQKNIVIVNSGDKDAEKRFLGYEFSKRRGNEGMHAMQRNKSIDNCTQLYDNNNQENPEKASSYIYSAFTKKYLPIDEAMKNNVAYADLVDMLTFDRENFDKNISTAVKKKVKIESTWENKKISEILSVLESGKRPQGGVSEYHSGIPNLGGEHINLDGTISIENMKFVTENYFKQAKQGVLNDLDILICKDGALTGKVALFKKDNFPFDKGMINEHVFILRTNEFCLQRYLFDMLFSQNGQELLKLNITGTAQGGLNRENLLNIQIPLPPLEIQQKIVSEIEVLEKKEVEAKEKITNDKEKIETLCIETYSKYTKEKLAQLATINPSKTELSNLDINTKISFIDMPSVSNDGYIANKTDKFYGEIKRGSYTYFREGDIIIAKITPCMENGKCALATNLTNGLALGSSEFHVFRANNDKIAAKFLFALLNRKSVRIEAEKNMTGTSGHRRVPIAFYENLEIPVPPLPEQQKIVAEIENIEAHIAEAQKIIDDMPVLKNEVLTKYL